MKHFPEAILAAEARIFTGRKMQIAVTLWALVCAVALGSQYFDWHWPYIPTAFSSGCVDWGWTWISGKFAALGEPARVFDYGSFAKAQSDVFGVDRCTVLFSFPYPPTMLFFTAPFGLLPFTASYVLWTIALAALLLGTVYAIVRRALAVVGAAAVKPAMTNIYLGQNAFLSSGLMGAALIALDRRPVIAGFLLALMTYKPQYGLLIPIALVASRNWRALASAAVFSLALAAASALVFGREGWPAFYSHMAQSNEYLNERPGFPVFHYSVYGLFIQMGFSAAAAWVAHGLVLLFLGVVVWRVWSKPFPYSTKAALLCVASLLASPYVLYYQLSQLVIAFAFLVREGLRRGFLAGERTVITVAWLALNVASQSVALAVCAALLWLIYRRLAAPRAAGVQVQASPQPA